jgi:hypothetical protein
LVALANFMRLSSRKAADPGFPVKFTGVDAFHAAFLDESRTHSRLLGPRTGNPGTLLCPLLRARKSGVPRICSLITAGGEMI